MIRLDIIFVMFIKLRIGSSIFCTSQSIRPLNLQTNMQKKTVADAKSLSFFFVQDPSGDGDGDGEGEEVEVGGGD